MCCVGDVVFLGDGGGGCGCCCFGGVVGGVVVCMVCGLMVVFLECGWVVYYWLFILRNCYVFD